MAGIAERLAEVLQSLVTGARTGRSTGIGPEGIARIEEWAEAGELPSLAALAEILEQRRSGFGALEWTIGRWGRYRRDREGPPAPLVSPRLLVSRLDIGLRALRGARGLTQGQVAEAAGFRHASILSAWERPETGERPSVEELDRLLRALRASYLDLEQAVKDPFRAFRALERRLASERPVVLDGEVLPKVVSERFDLALRVLRTRKGWTRPELARHSGLKDSRIAALEKQGAGDVASEKELKALLEALEASGDELQQAAQNPMREVEDRERHWQAVEHELRRTAPIELDGKELPRVVSERFDLALRVLRSRRGWSRRKLSQASGVGEGRVMALETRGQGELPSAEEVSLLLGALGMSLRELEEAASNPLGELSRLERRWRKVERLLAQQGPTRIGAVRVPQVVTARFDLALMALRSAKGWSRKELAERAGLTANRVTVLEAWGGAPGASEAEAEQLRVALEAEVEDFEKAARAPLREVSAMGRRLGELRRALERRERKLGRARQEVEDVQVPVERQEGRMFEAARRAADSAERVRLSLAGYR